MRTEDDFSWCDAFPNREIRFQCKNTVISNNKSESCETRTLDHFNVMTWALYHPMENDTAGDVSTILTQTDRDKEQFVSNKFQSCKIALHKWQCDIVHIKIERRFEFETTSKRIVAKLRERFRNRDMSAHFVSVHCTRFATKERKVRWRRTRHDHVDTSSVPVSKKSECNSCPWRTY